MTTTGKGTSGSPFRGHRVHQIAPGSSAAVGAKGDLYTQVRRDEDIKPLRASFKDVLSEDVWTLARTIFRQEQPGRFAGQKSPNHAAMTFALHRLGVPQTIFDGNEIGVHIGMLGENTLDKLRVGLPRPLRERPLIDWERAVGVWSRRFLPAPELVGESVKEEQKEDHRTARQGRNERARAFPGERIRLSHLLTPVHSQSKPSLSDLELLGKKPSTNGPEQQRKDTENR